jgi:hypothetical protein
MLDSLRTIIGDVVVYRESRLSGVIEVVAEELVEMRNFQQAYMNELLWAAKECPTGCPLKAALLKWQGETEENLFEGEE